MCNPSFSFAFVPFIISGCSTNIMSFTPLSTHQGSDLCLSAHRSVKRERGCLLYWVHSSWKSRMPPPLRSLRLRTVRNSRTTQSGCVRHCSKHTVDLFWHPISLWREQIWEGKRNKSLHRSRTANFELVTSSYSTFLNVFLCLRSVMRGSSDLVRRDHSNTSQIGSWDSDPRWELFSPSTPVNLQNTTSLFSLTNWLFLIRGVGITAVYQSQGQECTLDMPPFHHRTDTH